MEFKYLLKANRWNLFKINMKSKINQTQKHKNWTFSLICRTKYYLKFSRKAKKQTKQANKY